MISEKDIVDSSLETDSSFVSSFEFVSYSLVSSFVDFEEASEEDADEDDDDEEDDDEDEEEELDEEESAVSVESPQE